VSPPSEAPPAAAAAPTDASPPLLLELAGVGKKFCRDRRRSLLYALGDLARDAFGSPRPAGLRPGEFWAVEPLSLAVRRGESVAVLGANGAGKSTLLRLIQGLFPPDAGEVKVAGALSTISDLGLGFDPRLSGRDNARHAATLLGVAASSEEELLASILDFSELGAVVDAPVSTYSSGMRARLGFAVAAQLRPDLLLIDEALAVGDFAFRRKCIRHLVGAVERGQSLLLVSHDLYSLQILCRRAIYLVDGRVAFDGPTAEAVDLYVEAQRESAAAAPAASAPAAARVDDPVRILGVEVVAERGGEPTTGEPAVVVLRYLSRRRIERVPWFFQFVTADLLVGVAAGVGALEEDGVILEEGEGAIAARIERLPLFAGTYALRAAVVEPDRRAVLALSGWNDAPAYVVVATPDDEVAKLVRLSRSLVEIDCEPVAAGRYHQ
jgi:ABC-type polysaccharide/polyol phosphate transport system ATPase subunit